MERPPPRPPSELALRAAEALDLFDPAVILPGALVGLALFYLSEIDPRLGVEVTPIAGAAAGVVLSCAVGHLCFSFGRMVRRFVNPWRRSEITQALLGAMRAHGLQGDGRFRGYFNHPAGLPDATALTARLWSELRYDPARAASYAHLRRLSQRAAMLDGMIPGLLVWIAVTVLAIVEARGIGTEFYVGIPILLGLVGAIVMVVREAGRCDRNLVEELVATAASTAEPSPVGAPVGLPFPSSQPAVQPAAPAALPAPQPSFAPAFAPPSFAPSPYAPPAAPPPAAPPPAAPPPANASATAPFGSSSVPTAPPFQPQPPQPAAQSVAATPSIPPAQPFAPARERESLHPSAPLEEVVFRPQTLISGTPLKPPGEGGSEPA